MDSQHTITLLNLKYMQGIFEIENSKYDVHLVTLFRHRNTTY